MGETPERQPVVAAVIRHDDRVLLCQRPPGKRHAGLWELPGGKLHPGETLADAAARELDEELGVQVLAVGEPLAEFADPGSPFVIVFVPVEIAGTPEAREHAALAWATPDEAAGYALAPSDRRFVDEVLRTG